MRRFRSCGPVQPDGTFSICDVPPGDYYLVANFYRNTGAVR
jgi:hypothetical protein